ncbi:MAG TPA: rhodanese-like domain-containing protein [Candidatus Udaeobacter sp.]|nr:rhodanese-like domain-containing protein [Candidatus Udaeobacter sp.]
MKFSMARQAAVVAALALLPAAGEAIYLRDKISWRSAIPPSEAVTVAQARAWGDQTIWVDARPNDEFVREHVPGAFSLNEDHWNELLPQFLAAWSPGKKIVVYCSAQSCDLAREVAERLRKEAQLSEVFVLEGGWEAWLKSNR